MEIQQPWFDYIISGRKKVEGRKGTPGWRKLKVGQQLQISEPSTNKSATVLITDIRQYSTLEQYLNAEGVENVLPDVSSIDEGIKIYKNWSTDEQIKKWGFLAIELKVLSVSN